MAGRPKGLPKTGGRAKGTPNKISGDLRSMILGALQGVGGTEYLQAQATENPAAFLSLLGKTVPKELSATGAITILVTTGVPESKPST